MFYLRLTLIYEEKKKETKIAINKITNEKGQ